MTEWPLQDAKNRFSAVVEAAVAGDPQRVTRRGKPAVVVLAVEEYERLRRLEKAQAPTLADLLLAIPQDDEEFERLRAPVFRVVLDTNEEESTDEGRDPPTGKASAVVNRTDRLLHRTGDDPASLASGQPAGCRP